MSKPEAPGRRLTKRQEAERQRRQFNPTPEEQDADDLAAMRRALARLLSRYNHCDRAVTIITVADRCVRGLAVLLGDPDFRKEAAQ